MSLASSSSFPEPPDEPGGLGLEQPPVGTVEALEPLGAGIVRVPVRGEFDVTLDTPFRERVLAALTTPDVRRVVVDLGEVTFIDSRALAALLFGRRRTQLAGAEWRLVVSTPQVERVIGIVGLEDQLGVCGSLSAAQQ